MKRNFLKLILIIARYDKFLIDVLYFTESGISCVDSATSFAEISPFLKKTSG